MLYGVQVSPDSTFATGLLADVTLSQLDSSLTARKELAKELHYTGDTNDSATMNIWLHGEVMKSLANKGA